MRSNRLIPAVAITGLTIPSANVLPLEAPSSSPRVVHLIDGPVGGGDHRGPATVSDNCPPTHVDVLSSVHLSRAVRSACRMTSSSAATATF